MTYSRDSAAFWAAADTHLLLEVVRILDGGASSIGGFVVGAVVFMIVLSMVWGIVNALIIGALARMLLPGKDQLPWWKTLLVGMAGSFLAGLVGWISQAYKAQSIKGFLASVVCALLILLVLRMQQKPKAPVGA